MSSSESASSQRGRVLIAGAGIGGLTAAAALRRRGFDVTVFEKAAELKPVGAGIVLAVNALYVMKQLGLYEPVRAAGEPITSADGLDWKGRVLSGTSFEALAQELGVFATAYHRADLHEVLLEAAGRDAVRLGAPVETFDQDERGVRVTLQDGTQLDGDLLIGADGLHSNVRRAVLGESPPRYAGYTSWRAITPRADFLPRGRTTEAWGPGKRFGIVPLSRGRAYWFAVEDAAPGGSDSASVRPYLREAFRGWHAPVEQLIEATPDEAILRTDIFDRDPVEVWGEGRVTLLGDAAHPMTPNLGQGACQAVEDAFVLTQELSDVGARHATIDAALRAYEQKRIRRTTPIVLQSRRFGEIAQWTNGAARWLRDRAMAATPRAMILKQLRRTLLDPSIYPAESSGAGPRGR